MDETLLTPEEQQEVVHNDKQQKRRNNKKKRHGKKALASNTWLYRSLKQIFHAREEHRTRDAQLDILRNQRLSNLSAVSSIYLSAKDSTSGEVIRPVTFATGQDLIYQSRMARDAAATLQRFYRKFWNKTSRNHHPSLPKQHSVIDIIIPSSPDDNQLEENTGLVSNKSMPSSFINNNPAADNNNLEAGEYYSN